MQTESANGLGLQPKRCRHGEKTGADRRWPWRPDATLVRKGGAPMKVLLGSLLLLAVLSAGGAAAFTWYLRHAHAGVSARAEPTAVEAALATAMRSAATPHAVRNRANPVPATATAVHEGMEHFADHCAVCHANNGSGQTPLAAGMYPKPPDMRLPTTQNKTDGELFGIIENGIRLSGMPAFGGAGGTEDESWKLVVFLRHLPRLTEEEEQAMEHLNPKSPGELQEEKREADFLNGGSPGSP